MSDPEVEPGFRSSFQADRFQVEDAETHKKREEDRAEWCDRFFRTITEGGHGRLTIQRETGTFFIALPGQCPRPVDNPGTWHQVVPQLVNIYRSSKEGGGVHPSDLTHDETGWLFGSDSPYIPEFTAVLREPVILFKSGGGAPFQIEPGYNRNGYFYYTAPGQKPILPLPGVRRLTECFSGVPFSRPEYRNNLLGWLLGAIYMDPRVEPPLLVITGNQQGIGKSKTQEAAGMIITGSFPAPICPYGDEFEKQLASRFRDAARFISLDNVVTNRDGRSNGFHLNSAYRNDRLARFVTQGFSKRIRILGQTKDVEQKGTLFALNANDCKLDADLSTRALPVKLYRDKPCEMIPYVKDYAFEHREEIYGELLNLALTPISPTEEVTSATAPTFRFRRWLSLVSPRIKRHFGEMALEESSNLDDNTMALFNWGLTRLDQNPDFEFTSTDLISAVNEEPMPSIKEFLSPCGNLKGQKKRLTSYLTNKLGARVELPGEDRPLTLEVAVKGDSNNPTRFRFSYAP